MSISLDIGCGPNPRNIFKADEVWGVDIRTYADKPEIRNAIEEIFDVKVTSVNTLNRKGKTTRNRRTGKAGSRPDRKRAIVTVAEGDSIDIFKD